MKAPAAVGCALGLALAWPNGAIAHPGPATPPEFLDTQCIQVVDTRTTTSLHIPYRVGFDDTMPEPDHLNVSDSKTYQFFAFRGALQAGVTGAELYPFAPDVEAPLALPDWFSRDDVMRSAAINTPMIAPDFRAEDIAEVLEDAPALAPHWLAVTSAAQRVPITLAVSQRGVNWDLKGVPPGVYQLAGYVFSPPYNWWEPRPGLVKLIDGERNAPALSVGSIDGILYSGQGRRITGCIDAPPGSKLDVSYGIEGPNMTWQTFVSDLPATGTTFEVCFHSPDPKLAGFVHVRVQATAPDGTRTLAYAPDKLVLVANSATCNAGETTCCEPEHLAPTGTSTQAVSATAGMAGAAAAAGAPDTPAAAAGAQPPSPPMAAARHGACGVQPGAPRTPYAWLALALALVLSRARRRKR